MAQMKVLPVNLLPFPSFLPSSLSNMWRIGRRRKYLVQIYLESLKRSQIRNLLTFFHFTFYATRFLLFPIAGFTLQHFLNKLYDNIWALRCNSSAVSYCKGTLYQTIHISCFHIKQWHIMPSMNWSIVWSLKHRLTVVNLLCPKYYPAHF